MNMELNTKDIIRKSFFFVLGVYPVSPCELAVAMETRDVLVQVCYRKLTHTV